MGTISGEGFVCPTLVKLTGTSNRYSNTFEKVRETAISREVLFEDHGSFFLCIGTSWPIHESYRNIIVAKKLFMSLFSFFQEFKKSGGSQKQRTPTPCNLESFESSGGRLSRAVDPIQDHSRVEAMLREGALRGRMLLEFKSWPQMLVHI